MNLMKKIFSFILVLLVLLNSFPLKVAAINVAPLFTVEVTPYNAGSRAQYRIFGSYSQYNYINQIKVYFRDDTRFLSSGAPYGSVVVNGNPAKGTQFRKITSDNSVEATIYLSQYINNGDNIEIVFKKEAGIINPYIPATCYKVRVVLINNRGVEVQTILSNSYRITTSAIQGLSVKVEPAIRGMNAQYTVSFVTGVRGSLNSTSDAIKVRFPDGTTLPTSLSTSYVLINGNTASSIYRDSEDPYMLRVYAPFDIAASTPVTVVFEKEFGIINPLKSGMGTISVATDKEPDFITSEPFQIYDPQVKDVKVNLSPDSIGASPQIDVTFTTSPVGYLQIGKNIYLKFPDGFNLDGVNLSDTVYVKGQVAQASITNNILQIVLPVDVGSLSNVEITIKKEASIKNPNKQGEYVFNLWTDSDSFETPTTINIKESSVSDVLFNGLYSGVGSVNEFVISFKTGPVYTLSKDIDSITITFDEGFVLPNDVVANQITVNGVVASTVSKDVHSLNLITPIDILPLSSVEVKIPSSFGVKNPLNVGEYGVSVSTSKETEKVLSNKIKVTPLPVVEFTITPSSPDGLNGIYKTNPEVMLSTSNGVKVFYKIDEGEFTEFKEKFKVLEGHHTIYAYAEDSASNKGDIVKKEILVDSTPPVITIDNGNTNPVFKESPGKISGSVSEPCTLKINDVVLELKENLNFFVELNVTEGSPIVIYARDLAGNQTTILLIAHLDNIPPTVTFLNDLKKNDDGLYSVETSNQTYTLQGKLSENGKVFINNVEVPLNSTTFDYTINLNDGENVITVKVVDLAGNETNETVIIRKVNETKILLTIGSKVVKIGDNSFELQAAPFIENGVTLVPLRFITEAFNANLNWYGELKIITISYNGHNIQLQVDSTKVVVDDSIKEIQVAPKIVNGLTFVPLRFISETFGAQVLFDADTKTITIIKD